MKSHYTDTNNHQHVSISDNQMAHERRTWLVIALTATMMVLEITAGFIFGSMALLADGWHMASHASALGITAIAYYFARRYASDKRFSFGTGKISELAGYSSALLLALIALLMAYESITRFFAPVEIRFDEAIAVAVLGLIVNLVSALILKEKHEGHDHDHHHDIVERPNVLGRSRIAHVRKATHPGAVCPATLGCVRADDTHALANVIDGPAVGKQHPLKAGPDSALGQKSPGFLIDLDNGGQVNQLNRPAKIIKGIQVKGGILG